MGSRISDDDFESDVSAVIRTILSMLVAGFLARLFCPTTSRYKAGT